MCGEQRMLNLAPTDFITAPHRHQAIGAMCPHEFMWQ
jgi:hypothetical protein